MSNLKSYHDQNEALQMQGFVFYINGCCVDVCDVIVLLIMAFAVVNKRQVMVLKKNPEIIVEKRHLRL